MNERDNATFSPAAYLASAGIGRRIIKLSPRQTLFSQGNPADSVFYLQKGQLKLSVVSQNGKEATITLLSAGAFVGEEALAQANGSRTATAVAFSECAVLRIVRGEMVRVMQTEPSFAEFFIKFLLFKGMRTQADLVDHLFNSSEKRLARTLLMMAKFGKVGEPDPYVPPITQEALAEMVGTTRSRVSFFMNRFRDMGFIDYEGCNCHIQVRRSLRNVVLLDEPATKQSQKQPIMMPARYPEPAQFPRTVSQYTPRANSLGLYRQAAQNGTA